jgi:16S rRNA (guanine(527)-N(7))-methyltransferase RsmG
MESVLQSLLDKAGLSLTPKTKDQLLHYVDLLLKWNRAYNLTAIRDPKDILTKHIMDSLSIAPYVTGTPLLDIGSGAGLPGIPLAILNPERAITLLDSNGKKTRFLTQVKSSLNLNNVTIIQSRVESYQPSFHFDCIVSRAFATMSETLSWAQHLAHEQTTFLFMKGVYPLDEIAALPAPFSVMASHPLTVPHLVGERHLMCVGRQK